MTITPEWLSNIKQIAENAEQGPYMGLSNEEVLALVAAVDAGAADSRRLDALTQGIESGHVAFEDDPCVFCEVDEDECDGDSNDCRKNLYGKDFFRVWKTVDQASKSGVLIETTDPRAVADAILAAKEGKT